MKTFLVILFSLLTTFCYSQRIEIDDKISVVFPEQPIETEEVIEGYSTKLYSLNTTDSFLALRLQGTQQSLSLPTDKQQLKKLYEVISSDFINNLNRKGLKTHSSSFVQRNNLLVYQILFVDEKSTNQNGKAVVIYFNEVAYIFIYSELHKYSSERSNSHFLKFLLASRTLAHLVLPQRTKPTLQQNTKSQFPAHPQKAVVV